MPETLDVTGLRCPLPVLRARKAMKAVEAGGALVVTATDPAAVEDFRAFCEEAGHGFLEWSREGEVYRITLRKAGQAAARGRGPAHRQ